MTDEGSANAIDRGLYRRVDVPTGEAQHLPAGGHAGGVLLDVVVPLGAVDAVVVALALDEESVPLESELRVTDGCAIASEDVDVQGGVGEPCPSAGETYACLARRRASSAA